VPRTSLRQDSVTSHGSLNSEIYPQSYREEQAVHSSKIQGDSNRPEQPPLSYRDMILQRSANKENLSPSEGAPSGIDTAKTPIRKPIVASTSGKDAVDSSTLGLLPEVPSQPAPSTLAGADPPISYLRGCEINQERPQHWKPDERVATTHDGHPPRPEIHWQRGSMMRTDRNLSVGYHVPSPLVLAVPNGD
jgi:hypothetical protein